MAELDEAFAALADSDERLHVAGTDQPAPHGMAVSSSARRNRQHGTESDASPATLRDETARVQLESRALSSTILAQLDALERQREQLTRLLSAVNKPGG